MITYPLVNMLVRSALKDYIIIFLVNKKDHVNFLV